MPETRTIDLGAECSLHAVSQGEGPDVLLIHGALGTSHDWLASSVPKLLETRCRVTAVDRPGHGLSRRPRFEGTPRAQASQIREGLDALGIERPVIVAHSFGGLVSLAYAELHPDAVAGLVLVAPLAFPEPRLLEHSFLAPRSVPLFGPAFSAAADATVDAAMLKMVQKLMFAPQPVPKHWQATYPYEQLLTAEAMVFEGEDAAAILPMAPAAMVDVRRLATPSHILTGTSDKIVEDERQAKLLARLLPNARLTEAEGVGHMLHHARPELVVDAVTEALAPA